LSTSDATIPTAAADAHARPWRRAALWLALLAPFFYVTYGSANWLASLRSDVPSIVFDWERQIPFLGWTIIPYWSINAFYGLSLFVCATKHELDTHARRLLTAQIVAVLCFILFPLRFTFAQPETHGVAGFLFAALTSFDQPFNQAPSLHIALLVILWVLYARHIPRWRAKRAASAASLKCTRRILALNRARRRVPRWALWLLHPWFLLVGLSVLTTYQHHFIDIPTGALLGFLCLWLWPDRGPSPLSTFHVTGDRRRRVLAARYVAAAIIVGALALWIGGAGLWLLWPAISLLLVAMNYAVFGPAGFQKCADGHMSLAARALLAPYLVGAFLNSRAWTRKAPAPVAVTDAVALGRLPDRRVAADFPTIIDMSAELPRRHGHPGWRSFPALDLVAPEPQLLRAAAAAIEEARARGRVLVCCALGYSRSAAALATWLVAYGHADSVVAATERIRAARPRIVLGDDAMAAIARAALASEASGQRGDSTVRAPDTRPEPGSSARAALLPP
jgi:membrane-associated phospholipid phosphatase